MFNYLKKCMQSNGKKYEILFSLFGAMIILLGAILIKGSPDSVSTMFLSITTIGWFFTRNLLPEK